MPRTVLLPTGTAIEVLTVEQIATDVNRAGDVLRGSLAAPIVVAGRVAVPRGAPIYLRALAVQSAEPPGRPAELRLALDHLGSHGHSCLLRSSSVDLAIPPGNPTCVSPGTALEFQLIAPAALPRGSRAK
ncbi:MAG TPA: hypothetical protein VGS20_14485 [Candidatus Acidoferrales bacterium]|nr:hypothetical protein [Candidatus Acidoferrales bacterium]